MPKVALRSRLVAARAALTPSERAERAASACARLLAYPPFAAARTIAAHAALGAELDPSAALEGARARGARILYPRARPGARALAFAEAPPPALVKGPLGALEPPPSAPEVEAGAIDLVLVPAVAFSEDGLRLGRGGGYYDATLAGLARAHRVGLAFDLQVVAAVPVEAHDLRVDAVVTEARLLVFPRDRS